MEIDQEKINSVMRNPFFAGGIGSVVALRWAPGISWLERFFNVSCGIALAGFLSEPLSEVLKLRSQNILSGSAFLIGLFGMNIVFSINKIIRSTKLSDILPWISKR